MQSNIADFVNGCFEWGATLFILNNCRVLYRHKKIHGVSILSTAFFTLWAFWNIYYYSSLNQWWSWWSGILVTIVNTSYVAMMLHYDRRNTKRAISEYLTDAHAIAIQGKRSHGTNVGK